MTGALRLGTLGDEILQAGPSVPLGGPLQGGPSIPLGDPLLYSGMTIPVA